MQRGSPPKINSCLIKKIAFKGQIRFQKTTAQLFVLNTLEIKFSDFLQINYIKIVFNFLNSIISFTLYIINKLILFFRAFGFCFLAEL